MKRLLTMSLLSMLLGPVEAGELLGITPDEVQALQSKGAVVVDVRTPEEWNKTGLIPGSKGLTYFDSVGGYDKEVWLKQLKSMVKSPDQPVILVCAGGKRSALVGKMLTTEAGYGKVYSLDKGVRGWSAESKPLVKP